MSTTTEMSRTEHGSADQTQYVGALSPTECQQIVDDILDSLTNVRSPGYNPALAAEIQIWTELKNRQSDATANAVVDMVRAGDKPLHRFFPPSVQAFIGRVDILNRQQLHDGGGGGMVMGRGSGGYGQGSTQGQTGQSQGTSRYR